MNRERGGHFSLPERPVRYQRLRKPQKPLPNDHRIGKQTLKLGGRKQPDVRDEVLHIKTPLLSPWSIQQLPHSKPAHDGCSPVRRQEMHKRCQQMRLNGKVPVGRLHPIPPSGPHCFAGKLFLRFGPAHVLDYGIAENYVEGAFVERESAAIAADILKSRRRCRAAFLRPRRVQEDNGPCARKEAPDFRSATYVENPQPRRPRKGRRKSPHSPHPKRLLDACQ